MHNHSHLSVMIGEVYTNLSKHEMASLNLILREQDCNTIANLYCGIQSKLISMLHSTKDSQSPITPAEMVKSH